ncbi:MAG: DUF2905 domain-containing protein [Candidatus Neomarinimicrobiota bacterium]|nr:DUF2905 domain-containing protein [Candidatus Neomarinimicrobiota bacterium]
MIAVSGVVLIYFNDKLSWIGHLPGDIRIRKGNFLFYMPVATMVILNILVFIVFRLFQR